MNVHSRWWRVGPGLFFTVLLIPIWIQVAVDSSGTQRVVSLTLLTAYGLGYLLLAGMLWLRRLPARAAGAAVLTVIGAGFVATVGLGSMLIMAYAVAIVAIMLPPPWSIAGSTLILAGFGVATAIAPSHPWASWLGLLSIVIVLVLMGLLIRANRYLTDARHGLADLAVARERERVARDLHDVLGHSLTSLALKASLARRLLARGMVEQAAAEIADVERQARESLAEVRATVTGSREASLAAEVAGARVALEAGQIEVTVSGELGSVPAHLREPFAFVVREGVTNVIRHSGSTSCTIQISPSYVEVRDDGRGGAEAPRAGNGLTGLRQRLEAVGGSLIAGPAPGGGFRLRAEVLSG